MKIAVIIDAWEPIVGGSQAHVWGLSSQIILNYDCKIDIFTRALIGDGGVFYNQSKQYYNGRLRIFRIKPAMKFSNVFGRIITIFSIALNIVREHKKENYDLLHAHSILGGLIGKIAASVIKRPLVFTVHGSMNQDKGEKNLNYFVEKKIFTGIKYDKVISVAKGFLKYDNINKDIEIIPNGISLEQFDSIKDVSKTSFFKIIFVGRLHWQKGLDTLIESIKILKDNHEELLQEKQLKIHLIGYGFSVDSYKKNVQQHGLNDTVIFRGKITGEELIREYKSSRLFLLPSLCEGQPITFLEAMASKLPILTTETADNAEIIGSDIGWKIKENNPKVLATKILEAIQSPVALLENMGEKGYQNLKGNYTWDIIANKTMQIYNTLAK